MGMWSTRGSWWSPRGAFSLPAMASATITALTTQTLTGVDDDADSIPVVRMAAGSRLEIDPGTVARPGLAYVGDTDTGLYRLGANNPGLTVAGVRNTDWSGTSLIAQGNITAGGGVTAVVSGFTASNGGDITMSAGGQVLVDAGTVAAPGIANVADTNTGIYFAAANAPAMSSDGSSQGYWQTGSGYVASAGISITNGADLYMSAGGQVFADYGSAAAPGLSWNGDGNSGLWRAGDADTRGSGNGSDSGFKFQAGQIAIGTTVCSDVLYFAELGAAPAAFANHAAFYATDVATKTRSSIKLGAGGTVFILGTEA